MATQQATKLDYVPLPAALVKQIEAYWAAELQVLMHTLIAADARSDRARVVRLSATGSSTD